MDISVSLGTAFLAGVVSFLSPCVFPLVPSTIAFVSGLTFDELTSGPKEARRAATVHAAAFCLGFMFVFMTLGATATAIGQSFNRVLPWINRIGGGLIVVFGLYLMGVLKLRLFDRERRHHLARRPEGIAGSVLAGVVFGAGWTPCIGPVLGTILLLAGLQESAVRGALLLGVYGLGMAVPFFLAAAGFNWFLAGSERVRRFSAPLQKASGILLVVVGVLLMSGLFTRWTGRLAGLGQWITLTP